MSIHTPDDRATRHTFEHDGLTLSYLDFPATASAPDAGPDAPVLLALHGHLNEGRFALQGAVPPGLPYRVIAPDQRGHGESGHATRYETIDYVNDALALLGHLNIERASVLGHSLGAAVAYTLAAQAPDRVERLVVVDIGAEIDGSLEVTATWPRRAGSLEALVDAMGFMGENQRYVIREFEDGWGVPWNSGEMIASQRALNGDRWSAWLGSRMPALLIHGIQSHALSADHAEQMAARRLNTTLVHLPAGHAVYIDDPQGYSDAVTAFLTEG